VAFDSIKTLAITDYRLPIMSIDSILVFAPHPDDEVLGCGGYIAKRRAEGSKVSVIVVSDGARGLPNGTAPEVRQQECRTGLAHLGIDDVQFWGYPDTEVPLSGDILHEYRRIATEMRPTIILLPSPQESHPDHLRVTRGVLNALEEQWQGKLLFYETVHPATVINHVIDITNTFEKKRQAIESHQSQLSEFDLVTHVQALARLRGLHVKTASAEAFLLHEWDGTAQNFFETRPLISVIVRANDTDFLRHALTSLMRQTYEQFEVILVWFGDYSPSLKDFEVLDIRFIPGKPKRSFNLNLGLRYARGEYIAILDQDDVLSPNHFVTLLAEIHGQPKVDVVYSGCKVVACEKIEQRVKVNKVIEIKNHPWRPGRLLTGNFIPSHALLFRVSVFHTHQFDESLEIYEDWELLTRLSLSDFNFVHVDEITCEYRVFSEADIQSYKQAHEEKGYLEHRQKVVSKLLNNLDITHFELVASLVDDLEIQFYKLHIQHSELTRRHQAQMKAQKQKLAQFQGIEQLLAQACTDIGIEAAGRQGIAQLIGRALPQKTLFSIVLPVYNTEAALLSQTLLSVRNQAYTGWELCLVDDASDNEETQRLLQALPNDPVIAERLQYKRRDTQGGIVAASNDAIKMATAPYIAFLDHDDRLHNEALLAIALKLQQQDYTLLYTDSLMIDHSGQPMHAYNKADWSPETLLHLNHINHLTVVKRETLTQLGGLRHEFNGAQDWDLLLQLRELALSEEQVCHLRQPLYEWRATAGSVAYQGGEKRWAFEAAGLALKHHLIQRGLEEVSVTPNKKAAGFICQWRSPLEPIDIIIPTHNNVEGLKTCIEGLQQTDYPQFNILIIANRCSEPVNEFLKTLQSYPQIKILVNEEAFNWSSLNNQAVKAGNSPLLLFLNDDVEMRNAAWLRDMNQYLYLDGVGAVGATLYYPNGKLQHNGIETNRQWVARNIAEWGAKNPLRITRNVSAATGACLLTKRSVWEQVGEFDEKFAVAYNDVDFCLAVRRQGLRIVQATNVELIHHEHFTYGTIDNPEKKALLQKEANLMREKWGEFLTERYMPRYNVQVQKTRILRVGEKSSF